MFHRTNVSENGQCAVSYFQMEQYMYPGEGKATNMPTSQN